MTLLVGATCRAGEGVDFARGERVFRACVACHALERGANTPAGPNLHRIIGRSVAAEADFNYSPALRDLASRHPVWTVELLDRFLADPSAVAPGTEMGFIGLRNPGERQDLIAWLGATEPARD